MKHYFFKDEAYLDVVETKFQEKGVILASTDTILGLMGPVEQWAFEQLGAIKKRDSKPFVILINNYSQLETIVASGFYEIVFQFVKTIWPGPLTCIVPLSRTYKPWLFEIQKTVAIRMPLHQGLSRIIDRCGPLFSTSVNISGLPFATTIEEVDPLIMQKVSAIVLDEFQNNTHRPSTIVDLVNQEPIVVREGAISLKELIRNK